MTEMLDTCAVTVTDEITLLRERLDEAHAQMDNVERERDALRVDRDAALTRIGQLMDELKGVHDLLDMMTDASTNKADLLKREKKAHEADILRLHRLGERREIASLIAGMISGVTAAGLILAIVYLVVT
jgi:predicted  nucleic acid-binding Zn-ribbon protein